VLFLPNWIGVLRELHLHSTFGPPQSYSSEFVTSLFSVPLPLFTNRYFPLFASFFCVCTSILLSFSILCEQITADWPLVIKCMWRSTFKCRYCSVSPARSDRLNPGSRFYVQHRYFMRIFWLRVKLVSRLLFTHMFMFPYLPSSTCTLTRVGTLIVATIYLQLIQN